MLKEIKLQLHADESTVIDTGSSDGGNVESASVGETANSESASTDNSTEPIKSGNYALSFDRNGRPTVKFADVSDNKGEVAATEGQTAITEPIDTPQTEQKPLIGDTFSQSDVKPYNASELLLAIQSNTVDEKRVPDEYAMQYATIKVQREQATQQQQQQAQATQQAQNYEQQTQFYNRLEQMAKDETLKALNLSEEDIDAAEYSDDEDLINRVNQYETALAWNRSRIAEAVREQTTANQQAQAKQQGIYNNIKTYVNELKTKEPNFDKIDVMMQNYYQQLPYNEAKNVAEAITALNAGNITEKQCEDLKNYYDKTRVAYYAKANNLGSTPKKIAIPNVEQRGNGNEIKSNVDIDSLRNARTIKEKTAIIGKLLGY